MIEPLEMSVAELRQEIDAWDRPYYAALEGVPGTDVKRMSLDLPPDRFRRYIALCRALRFKTRPGKLSKVG